MEMEALAKVTPEIEALGASLVLISPQLVEHNRAVYEEKGLDAEILSYAEISPDYTVRPDPEETIMALKKILVSQ